MADPLLPCGVRRRQDHGVRPQVLRDGQGGAEADDDGAPAADGRPGGRLPRLRGVLARVNNGIEMHGFRDSISCWKTFCCTS